MLRQRIYDSERECLNQRGHLGRSVRAKFSLAAVSGRTKVIVVLGEVQPVTWRTSGSDPGEVDTGPGRALSPILESVRRTTSTVPARF